MIAKLRLVFTITILFVAFWGYSQNNYWAPASSADKDSQDFIRESNLSKSQVFSVDEHALKKTLAGVSSTAKNRIKIYFPDEFGVFKAYYIEEKSVLAPQLAAKYPQIKSYSGYGVEDEKSKIRFSASHNGFQVMMVHPAKPKTTFIQKSSKNNYVVYSRNGLSKKDNDFICSTTATVSNNKNASVQRPVSDQVLRKYRFAVSASGEYTGFHGGEVADALAAINATVTRVNQVFESDLAITLELVANNDEVIFTNGASDPYDDTGNLNAQVQSTLTQFIGEANYDIGHLFHLDANNGNAGFIGAICEDNRKGSAYSSAMEPEGDEFDIDFVAHEIGHQLGANHTWSFESEGTNVQAEPGSGSTIMGYAGITGENNVASKSDDYFHFYSILQIIANVASKSCGEITTLTNNPPVITAGPDYIIPTLTAFTLSADASDPDGDTLTYTWEQIDNGVVTRDTFGPENAAGANFRSRKPTTNPRRYFPSLLNIRSGNLTQTNPTISSGWETATSLDRKLNFAVTVRDNAANAGQVVSDLVQVSVVSSGSAFEVTSQPSGTSYTAGEIQEVSWNVAGTNQAPYDTPTVDILLSLDGGLSFPIVLAEAVLNDGMHEVLIPGNATADARIMVKANENIFFAMNEADFTILESAIVLSPMQTSFEVCQPADASIAFVYETYAGFSEEVTFSAVGLPNGLTATFNPATATANDTQVVLSLSGTANLETGTYDIGIQAVSASETKEITLPLFVTDANFSEVVTTSPVDGASDISIQHVFEWEADSRYTAYDIQIASDANFATIIDSGTSFGNTYLASNLSNATSYFWRVRPKNSCGEGVFGSAIGFNTIGQSCISRLGSDLPVPIASNGAPTITSTVEFFDDLILTDLSVNIELEHTYLGDLVITLTAPSGRVVTLFSRSCGNVQNINATFSDAGQVFDCSGTPAISGMVQPLISFSSLIGESIAGKWVLTVNDLETNDGGALIDFTMDVCAEGQFSADADGDGVFDANDLCPNTAPGELVDATGCPVYRLANNNFELKATSASCRNVNDGVLEISTMESLDYTVTVSGNGVNMTDSFTTEYVQNNLGAGTYTFCFDATDGSIDYEQVCFEVLITEPEPLSVSAKSNLEAKTLVLDLEGSDIYTISLNGLSIQTTKSQYTLDLKPGNNAVEVVGSLACQGKYEEQFFVASGTIVYPNPASNVVRLFIADGGQVTMNLYSIEGRLVHTEKQNLSGSETEIDVSTLSAGTYFLKVESASQKGTYKIIKE